MGMAPPGTAQWDSNDPTRLELLLPFYTKKSESQTERVTFQTHTASERLSAALTPWGIQTPSQPAAVMPHSDLKPSS